MERELTDGMGQTSPHPCPLPTRGRETMETLARMAWYEDWEGLLPLVGKGRG
ncbi:MAG: hypothetical protein JWP26_3003 [Devosia sp.]|nr:hypothetical protein [Devosia sp.]